VCLQSLQPCPTHQLHAAILFLGDPLPPKTLGRVTFTNNAG
jgi:hypothetical protein